MKTVLLTCSVLAASCSPLPLTLAAVTVPPPLVAAHQHLISPAFSTEVLHQPVLDGAALIKLMDEAGIGRGVVLSMGYSFADERKKLPNPDAQTAQENDWTSAQMVQSHGRLFGFCGVNPLRDAAVAEIDRCLRLPGMVGVKLHFGNSGVSLAKADHVARLQRVFATANARHAALVIHMKSRSDTIYTPRDAELFLDKLLPSAPDVVVQVAHLAGAGPGFQADAEAAFNVFASAIERHDPRTRNLYFDQCSVAWAESTPEEGAKIAQAIRRVGVKRIFFGSDLPVGSNPPPKESWAIFKAKVPLTPAEFRTIALNVPPYLPR
ncbi:MAG: amidohydrolase family protein [Sphingomicrobium sp.]